MSLFLSLFDGGNYKEVIPHIRSQSVEDIHVGDYHVFLEYFPLSPLQDRFSQLKQRLDLPMERQLELRVKPVLAWYFLRTGELDAARNLLDEVETAYYELDDHHERMVVAVILAKAFLSLGQVQRVEPLIEVIKTNVPEDVLFFRTEVTHIEANMLVNKGEYDLSLAMYRIALQRIENHGNNVEIARLLMRIGVVYIWKGENSRAIGIFKNCRDLFKETGIKRYEAYCTNNIAGLYEAEGEMDHAMEYFMLALVILRDIQDRRAMSRLYHNIANHHYNRKDYGSCEVYYQKSLELKKELSNPLDLARTYHGLGEMQYRISKIEEAQHNLENAVAYYQQSGNDQFVLRALDPLFKVYRRTKQLDKVSEYMPFVEEHTSSENKVNRLYACYISAVHDLKLNQNLRRSILYLKEITDDKIVVFELHVKSIIYLIRFYIESEQQSLVSEEECTSLISDIQEIADKSDLGTLQAEVKLLQTKFHILHGRMNRARQIFNEIPQSALNGSSELTASVLEVRNLLDKQEVEPDTVMRSGIFEKSLNRLYEISSSMQRVRIDEPAKVEIDPEQIPVAFFKIGDHGPEVLVHDLKPVSDQVNDEEVFLGKLSITIAVVIGQGHEYHEGVYDLPPGSLKGYRLILVTLVMGDTASSDPRLQKMGYFQYGLFIPTETHSKLPSSSKLETIIKVDKGSIDPTRIDQTLLYRLRREICSQLSDS